MEIEVRAKGDSFEVEEIIRDKKVKPFGKAGAHIIIPKKFIGRYATVLILPLVGQWLTGYRRMYKHQKKVPFPGALPKTNKQTKETRKKNNPKIKK